MQYQRDMYEKCSKGGLLEKINDSPLISSFLSGSEQENERVASTPPKSEPERYLVHSILPTLQKAVLATLKEARSQKALERKYTKFDPIDFLSEYAVWIINSES